MIAGRHRRKLPHFPPIHSAGTCDRVPWVAYHIPERPDAGWLIVVIIDGKRHQQPVPSTFGSDWIADMAAVFVSRLRAPAARCVA